MAHLSAGCKPDAGAASKAAPWGGVRLEGKLGDFMDEFKLLDMTPDSSIEVTASARDLLLEAGRAAASASEPQVDNAGGGTDPIRVDTRLPMYASMVQVRDPRRR
jgi:hypothetical protein